MDDENPAQLLHLALLRRWGHAEQRIADGPRGYGTTAGSYPYPNIFALLRDQSTGKWKFKVLHTFKDGEPAGRLIIDTSGDLYGLNSNAGNRSDGYAYEFTQNNKGKLRRLHKLYKFCSLKKCADGSRPVASLTYAGAVSGAPYDGVSPLFGMTRYGGAQGLGTAFELTQSGGVWQNSVLYNFCSEGGDSCTDGFFAGTALLLDGAGNLYGKTVLGGATNNGVIFELTNDGANWKETQLHSFCSLENCADGSAPSSDFLLDQSGNLLDTAPAGGRWLAGNIYRLTPNGSQSQYTTAYNFCSRKKEQCKDGATPEAGIIADQFGNLFGTTFYGGRHYVAGNGGGTVFELSGSTLTTLYDFCAKTNCHDGAHPAGPLIMDANGNLFGTTSNGGEAETGGTVFELSP